MIAFSGSMEHLLETKYPLMKFLFSLFVITITSYMAVGQLIDDRPRSPRNANYDIEVKLDAVGKMLNGSQTLTWVNTSKDIITTLQFHLYLNAFKNSESTFMAESGGRLRSDEMKKNDSTVWGWIDITKMELEGVSLLSDTRFLHPDDDNLNDQTVLEVTLPRPVYGSDTIKVNMDFVAKLPKIFARTGFGKDDYYLVAQWFPKIAVWEPAGMRYSEKGAWNCHQFHANSEFYADFGVYNVAMTVPESFVVGATGLLQEERSNNDDTKTYQYKALDVIDFAWTASPNYIDLHDKWKDTDIRLLIMPEHEGVAERYFTSTKQGLEYFDENLGEYPYSTLTVIDPPAHSSGAGGMEYPTFITGGSYYGLTAGLRNVELVTVHEFGHQYFMGLLASNEFEEPWLDEGFNTYFENRAMDHYYGANTSVVDFLGLKVGDTELSRASYVGMWNPKIAENFRPSWGYKHGGYGSLTYAKTGTWMRTLEGIIGFPTMDKVMKQYYQRWAFKHPCATDFIDVVNEVVQQDHGNKFGENMQWYFDQVLYGSVTCDYSVASIKVHEVLSRTGIFGASDEKSHEARPDESSDEEVKTFESRVILNRLQEMIVPVKVRITFDNGEEVMEEWSGKERSIDYTYVRTEKITRVDIDPDNYIKMDIDRINNTRWVEPEGGIALKYFNKVLTSFQHLLHVASALM